MILLEEVTKKTADHSKSKNNESVDYENEHTDNMLKRSLAAYKQREAESTQRLHDVSHFSISFLISRTSYFSYLTSNVYRKYC